MDNRNVSQENVSHGNVSQDENVSQENVSHGNVSQDENVSQENVSHGNVSQKSDVVFHIRMPIQLKEEIKRQANELNMPASSLAKVVLAQAFKDATFIY